MGLRAIATADARRIVENATDAGFSVPVTLTTPAGDELAVGALTTDIATTIDPETGVAVIARRASVTVALGALTSMPAAVADGSSAPWLATYADAAGVVATWKVIEVIPDRTLGLVVLLLEAYDAD